MIGPEVEPRVVLTNLVADFVTPTNSVVHAILTVVNSLGAIASDRPLANSWPVTDPRAITYARTSADSGSVANAGTISNTGSRCRQGARAGPTFAQKIRGSSATSHCAGEIAGAVCRKRARSTARLDVEKILQLRIGGTSCYARPRPRDRAGPSAWARSRADAGSRTRRVANTSAGTSAGDGL